MPEIFITVVVAAVVGWILIKYWRQILAFMITSIIMAIAIIIAIPLFIIDLPRELAMACTPDWVLGAAIVQCYDECFYEASSREEITKKLNTIKKIRKTLQCRKRKRCDKQVKKMLDEVKWLL